MNMKQMKETISKFRSADVSIIKDEKLRAKAQKLQAKQGGFTLLELLIVITLIATLATAALVAYDGIGESASDTAAANNLLAAQSALNNYRAIENAYPDQWDNLANASGTDTDGMATLRADQSNAFFGQWVSPNANSGTSVWKAVADALGAVGIEEIQSVTDTTTFDEGYVPNLALNESYPLIASGADAGDELVLWESDTSGAVYDGGSVTTAALSIVPSGGNGSCTADGASLASPFDGAALTNNERINLINDALDDDVCSLVVAIGYGKDVPGSTLGDKVEISQVPTLGTNNVNPNLNYARAVGLFLVAQDEDNSGTIEASEVLNRAQLIGMVDPEGRIIDEVLASANQEG
jgi:prepilin-type N-terminal cleavage/methylation domain-containing protein